MKAWRAKRAAERWRERERVNKWAADLVSAHKPVHVPANQDQPPAIQSVILDIIFSLLKQIDNLNQTCINNKAAGNYHLKTSNEH